MNIIRFALRKPITVIVAVLAIGYFSFLVVRKISVDIFPQIESPAIYIAMPYGGLSPANMDGFMANEFQKVLIFVSGIKDIELKSVQGFTLMKLNFYPGTDMAQSAGEVATQVSRAMGFLPPGAVPPQVVRFDASALPVGQLVFESDRRSITEIQNMVLTRIRPMFVTIPGITAPAPFGGSARSIVVRVKPEQMQALGLSEEEVMAAIAKNSHPAPAGNIRLGDKNYMSPVNSMAGGPEEFLNIPVRRTEGFTVFIKDFATVEDDADLTTGYAVINGKRSVYLPVIKKADASTIEVVKNLKKSLPMLQELLPDDVKMDYAFDQSGYIKRSVNNLIHEGVLGAILTGLMVLLFLGDRRAAFIVVLTIPISIFTAIIMLHVMGQTINMMTLSGLALAIGILVDEATVTIENIHQHLEAGKKKQRAVADALLEISVPKLIILLCILSVLLPSFVMTGIPKDMFLPLSMAVGFAMIASFVFSQTFVPVMANWLMKHQDKKQKRDTGGRIIPGRFDRFRQRYLFCIRKFQKKPYRILAGYGIAVILILIAGFRMIGTDILPAGKAADLQIRMAGPEGDRIEKTEQYLHRLTEIISEETNGGISLSSAFVGMQPATSAINPVFLFTSGSHEAVLQVSVDRDKLNVGVDRLKDNVRKRVKSEMPGVQISFEPIELVEKIMSQGANTPVQVRVAAPGIRQAEGFARKIEEELKKNDFIRDVRIEEPLHYPSLSIEVDRERAALFGLSMKEVTDVITMATSSTRYVQKTLWRDPVSGLVFQVQMQASEDATQELDHFKNLPLKSGQARPVLADVAEISPSEEPGQINRQGARRYVTLAANIQQKDLGAASKAVQKAIAQAGEKPKGVIVQVVGQLELLKNTLEGLKTGLVIAVIIIFLMLSAYFQSFSLGGMILSVVPAVVAGSVIFLLLFGSTLNLQSYMGVIMSVGVSVSNAFLLVDYAEKSRFKHGMNVRVASVLAASSRLRPVIMTTLAMIAGMIPMAIGFGEGGEQVAPLAQAVIGGLLVSTLTSLLMLPNLFVLVRKNASMQSVSLDPDDPGSRFAESRSPETEIILSNQKNLPAHA